MNGPAVHVDTASPVPPYEQIRAQLAALITTGRMPEGERLPTVRQPAADLGLAAGTVARAYRELEAASLIRTRRGAGTRVAPPPAPTRTPDPAKLAELARCSGRYGTRWTSSGCTGGGPCNRRRGGTTVPPRPSSRLRRCAR
ncbi:GntR family transcriptional regulator [Streptomyces sp. NBC_00151]|uniref:GntR family transcriptional regulator n=1 Tax=Streptomyces sp. NBC_00151 TaxID=2975669 RepID=UPI002DD8EC95|nr:GntR family transcriptional regulator [Streptomyces sp. NBC_00151]WRZ37134.1 GntR family transcriptional regulator [Streptomyces sp. NBC_00151]